MKAKPTIVLILFLLWGAGSTYWYVCKIKGFCENATAVEASSSSGSGVVSSGQTEENAVVNQDEGASGSEAPGEAAEPVHDLLYYKTGDSRVYVSNESLWEAEVKKLLAGDHKGKRLEITGPYYDFEIDSGGSHPGLARAAAVRDLLAKWTDTTGMLLHAEKLTYNGTDKPAYLDGYKGYVKWVDYNDFVKTEQDVTRIYFPFNSAKEIRTPEIISYLDQVAESLKKNPNWKVEITGHTDNIGSAETNRLKGMERAERIRDILLKKGVNAGQIITRSEGEDKPIADNATAAGRRQNRRVEIRFIK